MTLLRRIRFCACREPIDPVCALGELVCTECFRQLDPRATDALLAKERARMLRQQREEDQRIMESAASRRAHRT